MKRHKITLELGKEYRDPDEEDLIREIVTLSKGMISRAYKPLEARRDAHMKAHGCVIAQFKVESDLPAEMQHGVFIPGNEYQAFIRFSNAPPDSKRDRSWQVRGMGIKLLGV